MIACWTWKVCVSNLVRSDKSALVLVLIWLTTRIFELEESYSNWWISGKATDDLINFLSRS